jgi:hypothetical protein
MGDDHSVKEKPMSALTYIFLSALPLLIAATSYLWYITPDPEVVAEEVLGPRKRRISAATFRATKPQPDMTHINCLS